MSWTIHTDPRGWVWLDAGPENPDLTMALADSVGCLSPMGHAPSLSTFWIDRAIAGAEAAAAPGVAFIGGNETSLVRSVDGVIASSDYELFADVEVPLDQFIEGLTIWREAVVDAIERGQVLTLREGVTYFAQRNPGPNAP